MRKAISGDKAAWQFTRSDNVARRTPKISAAGDGQAEFHKYFLADAPVRRSCRL